MNRNKKVNRIERLMGVNVCRWNWESEKKEEES